jgi:hypothetical protein
MEAFAQVKTQHRPPETSNFRASPIVKVLADRNHVVIGVTKLG